MLQMGNKQSNFLVLTAGLCWAGLLPYSFPCPVLPLLWDLQAWGFSRRPDVQCYTLPLPTDGTAAPGRRWAATGAQHRLPVRLLEKPPQQGGQQECGQHPEPPGGFWSLQVPGRV